MAAAPATVRLFVSWEKRQGRLCCALAKDWRGWDEIIKVTGVAALSDRDFEDQC